MLASEAVIQCLLEEGVSRIFGQVSLQTCPLMEALREIAPHLSYTQIRSEEMRHIWHLDTIDWGGNLRYVWFPLREAHCSLALPLPITTESPCSSSQGKFLPNNWDKIVHLKQTFAVPWGTM